MYKLLNRSAFYNLVQHILAPGAERRLTKAIQAIAEPQREAKHILDVGCGPASWLWRCGMHPVGLDITHSYIVSYCKQNEAAVVCSANTIAFKSDVFDAVWSIGLLHHLPDGVVGNALQEMIRVCRPGGVVIIFDGVYPESALRFPLAWLLRRIDRGRHMRQQATLEALLPERASWIIQRVSYSAVGHEGIFCSYAKSRLT